MGPQVPPPSMRPILLVNGIGNVTSQGIYAGIHPREYILEIDGEKNGPTGKDTFRWSIDGGGSFNSKEWK